MASMLTASQSPVTNKQAQFFTATSTPVDRVLSRRNSVEGVKYSMIFSCYCCVITWMPVACQSTISFHSGLRPLDPTSSRASERGDCRESTRLATWANDEIDVASSSSRRRWRWRRYDVIRCSSNHRTSSFSWFIGWYPVGTSSHRPPSCTWREILSATRSNVPSFPRVRLCQKPEKSGNYYCKSFGVSHFKIAYFDTVTD